MGSFTNSNFGSSGDATKDLQNYRIELERKLRHLLRNIDISSIILGLSSSRLVSTNASGDLESVSTLTDWIAGVTNQIIVTNDLDGTVTLSLADDIIIDSVTSNDLTATRLVSSDGSKKLVSASLFDWIDGTSGNLTVTDNLDGTVTLKSIGAITNVTLLTDTDTLTVAQQGFVECNKATAMTVNLPTAVGNAGLSYSITSINTGTVTIDPDGTETLQGDLTFDLYEDENIQIISNGTNWSVG